MNPRGGSLSVRFFSARKHSSMQARGYLGEKDDIAEIPRIQRHVGRPQLDELFTSDSALPKAERNRLIRMAHGKHGYTLKEISRALGIHYTTVSKIINR